MGMVLEPQAHMACRKQEDHAFLLFRWGQECGEKKSHALCLPPHVRVHKAFLLSRGPSLIEPLWGSDTW